MVNFSREYFEIVDSIVDKYRALEEKDPNHDLLKWISLSGSGFEVSGREFYKRFSSEGQFPDRVRGLNCLCDYFRQLDSALRN